MSLLVEVFDRQGKRVEQYRGPTEAVLQYEHRTGKCQWTCQLCYELAMRSHAR